MKKTFSMIGLLFSTKVISHETFVEHQHGELTTASSLTEIEAPLTFVASQSSINEFMVLAVVFVSIVSLGLILRNKIPAREKISKD